MADKEQLEQFKQAVDEKNDAAREKAEQGPQNPHEPDVEGGDASQDTEDVRAKSSRHGGVTADKWNQ